MSATTTQPRLITVQAFWQAMVNAGVFREDESVRRVVIGVNPDNHAVVMYVERWGDERLLQVATTLDGVEIRGVPTT